MDFFGSQEQRHEIDVPLGQAVWRDVEDKKSNDVAEDLDGESLDGSLTCLIG